MPTFTTDRILAFRLRAHALADRLDEDGRAAAASRCGIQDSPPGSALLALNARVRGVTAGTVDDALAQRELVRTWSMRGAPFVVPAGDLPVFTTGVLPPSEAGAQRLILGVGPALDALGIGLDGAVSLIAARTHEVLSGRRLAIDALGAEVARAVEPDLSAAQRTVWRSEGPHAPGQPIGEAVVHFCVRILCLQRVVCFAPREGNSAPFVLADEWLGPPTAAASADDARAELARRYLRCYGPSTRAGLATWLGIRSGDAEPWWTAVEPELERVDTDGGPAWILATDRPALADAAAPSGVRLLPPRDPYTQAPDRSLLVPAERQREVWRAVGEPGTVLLDGRIAGTWRPRKRGKRLTLTVTAFGRLTKAERAAIVGEAESIAPLRGAATVDVEFAG